MADVWRSQTFTGAGPQVSWASSSFGSAPYGEVCGWLTGETLLRTRIQGQVLFALADADPTATASGWYTSGGQRITFGVFADKFHSTSDFPAGIPQGTLDPYFTVYDQMIMTDLSQFHTGLNEDCWTATYSFARGGLDSAARRGPAQHDNFVWLVWDFFNPLFNPPVDGGTPLNTFFSYALTVNCLFRQP